MKEIQENNEIGNESPDERDLPISPQEINFIGRIILFPIILIFSFIIYFLVLSGYSEFFFNPVFVGIVAMIVVILLLGKVEAQKKRISNI